MRVDHEDLIVVFNKSLCLLNRIFFGFSSFLRLLDLSEGHHLALSPSLPYLAYSWAFLNNNELNRSSIIT